MREDISASTQVAASRITHHTSASIAKSADLLPRSLQFREPPFGRDEVVREIGHEDCAGRRMRPARNAHEAKILVEDIRAMLPPPHAIIDNERHNRVPRARGAVKNV